MVPNLSLIQTKEVFTRGELRNVSTVVHFFISVLRMDIFSWPDLTMIFMIGSFVFCAACTPYYWCCERSRVKKSVDKDGTITIEIIDGIWGDTTIYRYTREGKPTTPL
jgi:hypothetical protein